MSSKAADAGHTNIADDGRRCTAVKRLQYRIAAVEAFRVNVDLRQGFAEHPADGVVIINNPDQIMRSPALRPPFLAVVEDRQ